MSTWTCECGEVNIISCRLCMDCMKERPAEFDEAAAAALKEMARKKKLKKILKGQEVVRGLAETREVDEGTQTVATIFQTSLVLSKENSQATLTLVKRKLFPGEIGSICVATRGSKEGQQGTVVEVVPAKVAKVLVDWEDGSSRAYKESNLTVPPAAGDLAKGSAGFFATYQGTWEETTAGETYDVVFASVKIQNLGEERETESRKFSAIARVQKLKSSEQPTMTVLVSSGKKKSGKATVSITASAGWREPAAPHHTALGTNTLAHYH